MKISLSIEIADEDAAQLLDDIKLIRELLERLDGTSLKDLQEPGQGGRDNCTKDRAV